MNFEEVFANSPDFFTRKIIAENPQTPIHILETIANHDISIEVLKSLLNNTNLPKSIYEIAANRLNYLTDENNEKKVWIDLLNYATDSINRIDIVRRQDCPIWLLEIVIKNDSNLDVVEMAIKNPKCTIDLKNIGKKRIDKTVKMPIALCPIPWTHLGIEQNGDFRVCCLNIYDPFGNLRKGEEIANINNTTFDEARNLPLLKELRKNMVNGVQHNMCRLCYDNEKLGLVSKRKVMLQQYANLDFSLENEDGNIDTKKFPLRYMDIRFGNLCNLTCRSCGPKDSSLWIEDYLSLEGKSSAELLLANGKKYEIAVVKNKPQIVSNADDFFWYEQENFWKEIDLHAQQINRFYFTGGEPTINKTHYKLLEYCIANKISKNIKLEYNSNMVALPKKLYEYWENFNEIGIGCSIDGIYDYANYIRPPSKWEVLEENLDNLGYSRLTNLTASISTTISVFNILHFLEISKWLSYKNYTNIISIPTFHMLEGPDYLNVQILPLKIKEEVKKQYDQFYKEIEESQGKLRSDIYRNYFSGIITHMMSKHIPDSSKLKKLKEKTEKIDCLKGQSLEKTIPWLFQVLQDI